MKNARGARNDRVCRTIGRGLQRRRGGVEGRTRDVRFGDGEEVATLGPGRGFGGVGAVVFVSEIGDGGGEHADEIVDAARWGVEGD